ncbi:conserved hypothetical protein [Nitrosomonas nitrosa]|uniref:Uncharacterized protein n=1 Tax=Nitrosomonas nitrosa TaxID=52442 RepID=A0A8H8YWR4_9PROT|nr:hypothetical protein [Nitrosomonas nitrosa]CAE6483299.1 conserved hypothetical protein [Nitrosomonas nitrosa]
MSQKKIDYHKTVVLIAPHGEPGKRVRLAKTIRIIKNQYHRDIAYWGWKRTPDETLGAHLEGIVESNVLLKGGGFRSALTRFYYLAWMLRVFLAVLWHAPQRVYCLGLETALPVWVASRLRRRIRYVFDDADRLVLLWNLPNPIEKMITALERKVSRDAITHIVPTLARYDYRTSKLYEIANVPEKNQVEEAISIAKPKQDNRLHVYINGWLNKSRGLELIDRAAEILEEKGCGDIIFNVAIGRMADTPSNFLKRCNVNHLGYLTHTASLAQYIANDVVITFYDPMIRINRYALPNKWGDAIVMGTPVILNEGIETAAPLMAAGMAFTVPFDDPDALVKLLLDLQHDHSQLVRARAAITNIKGDYKPFDEAIIPVMTNFLEHQ